MHERQPSPQELTPPNWSAIQTELDHAETANLDPAATEALIGLAERIQISEREVVNPDLSKDTVTEYRVSTRKDGKNSSVAIRDEEDIETARRLLDYAHPDYEEIFGAISSLESLTDRLSGAELGSKQDQINELEEQIQELIEQAEASGLVKSHQVSGLIDLAMEKKEQYKQKRGETLAKLANALAARPMDYEDYLGIRFKEYKEKHGEEPLEARVLRDRYNISRRHVDVHAQRKNTIGDNHFDTLTAEVSEEKAWNLAVKAVATNLGSRLGAKARKDISNPTTDPETVREVLRARAVESHIDVISDRYAQLLKLGDDSLVVTVDTDGNTTRMIDTELAETLVDDTRWANFMAQKKAEFSTEIIAYPLEDGSDPKRAQEARELKAVAIARYGQVLDWGLILEIDTKSALNSAYYLTAREKTPLSLGEAEEKNWKRLLKLRAATDPASRKYQARVNPYLLGNNDSFNTMTPEQQRARLAQARQPENKKQLKKMQKAAKQLGKSRRGTPAKGI